MHCREARRLLVEGELTESLRSHITGCESCRRFMEAERLLSRALAEDASLQDAADISLAEMRRRIESSPDEPERGGVIPMAKKVVSRPGFAVGFSVATVALLVAVLVPFTFESTVGYTLMYETDASDGALQKEALIESIESEGIEGLNIGDSKVDSLAFVNIAGIGSELHAKTVRALVEAIAEKPVNLAVSRVRRSIAGTLYARAMGEAEQTVEVQSWLDARSDEEAKRSVEKSLEAAGIEDYEVTVSSSEDKKTRTIKLTLPEKITIQQTMRILGSELKLGSTYDDLAIMLMDLKGKSDQEIRQFLLEKIDSLARSEEGTVIDSLEDGSIRIRRMPDNK